MVRKDAKKRRTTPSRKKNSSNINIIDENNNNMILIIGAGPSGLVTLKTLLENNYNAIILEASSKIGGTFANLTNNNVNIFVEVNSGSTSTNLANDIPVPTGSSFVISDAGKTIMIAGDQLRVYCDTADAIDVTLGILQGVS